jgi:hypothetical protein
MASMDCEVDYATKLFGGSIEYVDTFRLLMRKYRALASGSAVLRLFVEDQAMRCGEQPQAWTPSDLDVYVSRRSLGAVGLLDWHVHFTEVEGMNLDDPQKQREYVDGEVSFSSLPGGE